MGLKMKKFYNGYFIVFFASLLAIGCTKDIDDQRNHLGRWIEESPVQDRTEIFFLSPDIVVLGRGEGSEVEEFDYYIQGDSIYLSPRDKNVYGDPFFFKLIDQSTLQIENLYPSIPEDETSFIIFRRNP